MCRLYRLLHKNLNLLEEIASKIIWVRFPGLARQGRQLKGAVTLQVS